MPVRTHEKRRRRRARARQAAWIKRSANTKPIACVLWDVSEGGARIAAAHADKLPDVFTLIADKKAAPRLCRVAWRRSSLVGVQFIDAAEADALAARPRSAPQSDPTRPAAAQASLSQVLYRAPMDDSAKQSGFSLSLLAAGFLLVLVALTIVLFVAGQETGAGVIWADAVCREAGGMCLHPEFGAGASVLMVIVYCATKGMEL